MTESTARTVRIVGFSIAVTVGIIATAAMGQSVIAGALVAVLFFGILVL